MQERLTNSYVSSLKPTKKAYEKPDRDLKGFIARIQPTGLKTYYFAYRNAENKRKRIITIQAHSKYMND